MKNSEKKQKILEAAMRVIRTQGMEKTTVREIASQAGVTTGAVYHYYKNKEELFQDIINESIHSSQRIITAADSGEKTQQELFNEIADNVRRRLLKEDEQKLHIALLGDLISKNDENRDRVIKNYKMTIQNAGNLFGPASGIENDKYKYLMASFFVAALDGMAIQRSLGVYPAKEEMVIETFIEFFKEAILRYLAEHKE